MTKEQRQEREREVMRARILETAGSLVAEQGIDKLSIRKIAERMEYSPGIIYHYFQGKEDLVAHLLQQGYKKMITGLHTAPPADLTELSPEETLSLSLSQFIRKSVEQGAQYRNVMLSDSEAVLNHTGVLHQGAAREREALAMLCRCLMQFEGRNTNTELEIELLAQMIWSAAFGLIIRLTVERNLPEKQKEALISCHIEAMLRIARG